MKRLKVGIIGAGFVGLSAGYNLAKAGHGVTIFEKGEKSGGLAVGFEQNNWEWTLERHYHHWFTSDSSVLDLAKEVGQKVLFMRPKTSTLINSQIRQLDSPINLLKFSELSVIERFRMGAVLLYLKLTPIWKPLEKLTAANFISKFMGKKSWEVLWGPLFKGKFASFADEIPASWFWARIKKRSAQLGYPIGGFQAFADRINVLIHRSKGVLFYKTSVNSVEKKGGKFVVNTNKGEYEFDKVICTLSSALFVKVASELLPISYKKKLLNLKGIGAVTLILSLKNQFLTDGTYWLNVTNVDYPFLAICEHTNFMDKKHYGGEHVVYVGNYLPHDHKYYKYNSGQLLKEFLPYLKKINPRINESQINESYVFKAPFAQPIVPLNYSKQVPTIKTPIEGLYLANIQQVYPWDRGTNYAVELGNKVAKLVISGR